MGVREKQNKQVINIMYGTAKLFLQRTNACACKDCPHMKLNSLEKLYLCMEYETPAIDMNEELRLAAKKPIDRMLKISAKAGL